MTDLSQLITPKKNIKLRTAFRDTIYHVLRKQDKTAMSFSENGDEDNAGSIFKGVSNTFMMAFAVGFHFNKTKKVGGPDAINHVNVQSLDSEFKELAVTLVIKRHPGCKSAEDVWDKIESYAEYGIEIIFHDWKQNKILDFDKILGDN